MNLLSPEESSLVVRAGAGRQDADRPAGGAEPEGREIWRWFVLAAGLGLLLEWIVFTLKSRA